MKRLQEAELLDLATKEILKDVARDLHSHKEQMVDWWVNAFRESPLKRPDTREEESISILRKPMELFADYVQRGRFDSYLEQVGIIGKAYAREGLPYVDLTLATGLYAEAITSLINGDGLLESKDYHATVAAVYRFSLTLLSVLCASYGEIEQERLQHLHEGNLVEAKRRQDQMISMIVHDFRGPLTSILGFTQLLEKAIAKGKSCEPRQLEIIFREAKRLDKMAGELADMSLIAAERLELEKKPTDIMTMARNVVAEMQPEAHSHNLILRAPEMPIVGNWDHGRLTQALKYLIENAMRFSPDGGDVVVKIDATNDNVKVTVSDRGIGIPKELIPEVFEPFSRFYRERRIKGMGMGLFIAKGIVEAHGGSISLESAPGKGSKFTIALPL